MALDKYRQGFQLLGEKQDLAKCWRQGGRKGKAGKVPGGNIQRSFFSSGWAFSILGVCQIFLLLSSSLVTGLIISSP